MEFVMQNTGFFHRLKRSPAERWPSIFDRSMLSELVKLAWPIAAAMAGETVIGLVDTKLVGGLGTNQLAGVGVGSTFMFLAYIVVFGILRGVKIRTAYAVGEGRAAGAYRYAQAGILLGFGTGLLAFVLSRDVSPVLE